jgi:asparagine synthase (glutamine-hydrolysing)
MSGLIAFTGPPDRLLARRMLGRIAHRGKPIEYATGHATGPDTGPWFLESPFGSVAICEWESFPKLGLIQSGYSPCPGGEHGPIAQWGLSGFAYSNLPNRPTVDAVTSIRGSFAIACLAEGALTILRDPTGCQSLYYGRVGGRWLVASEPKAFTSEAEFSKRIRPAAIAQYLAFSFVPGRETMLEDVFEAEAGHLIRLRCGEEPEIVRTFRFEDHEWCESQPPGDRDEHYWIEAAHQAVQQAVAERLTDQPAAVFLSGGLDSSVIAAEVARQSSHPVHTFSIHFGTKYPNELDFAKQVAERIGSRHEEVLIQPKHFLPRLRQMIWHLDEPIGDPITQPNFELASHVGKNFDAVFNGEGGDPLFGGPKNIPMMMLHWYGDVERPVNFREQAYLASYRRAYEEWSRLLTNDVRRAIDPERDLEQVLVPFFNAPKPTKFLNKLMAINIRLKGANLILPKVDRMLAAHGLTPLSPLFDDRLTRLSFEMPPRMKLRSGIEKYVLKRAYEHALPASVIERPKSGMRVPVHYWFQKELRRYAASILSKKNIRQAGIFDPDRVSQLLRYETEEGPGRYGLRLWMLLTFEIWRRMVIEGE